MLHPDWIYNIDRNKKHCTKLTLLLYTRLSHRELFRVSFFIRNKRGIVLSFPWIDGETNNLSYFSSHSEVCSCSKMFYIHQNLNKGLNYWWKKHFLHMFLWGYVNRNVVICTHTKKIFPYLSLLIGQYFLWTSSYFI